MGGAHEFTVTTTAKTTVAATLPIQEHWLALSNLDLLLPPLNVHVVFCYKRAENDDFKEKVSALKKGLAQALVSYYAFAGELVKNSAGEPEILCNNRGVDFVEAVAEVRLCELLLCEPGLCFDGKLVPVKGDGVLSVQVTKLECGAITIGCTFDHRVADAYSANMFWLTWSHITALTSSKSITTHPCFRRSLLNPRRPLTYPISLNDMYVPVSALARQDEPEGIDSDPLISRIYHISVDQLCRLQCLASDCSVDCCKGSFMRSKFQSFSAFLWKLVAAHAYEYGHGSSGSGSCKMGIVVDGRTRLGDGESKDKSTSFFSYFGNVLSIPFGEEKCEDLTKFSLASVTNKVHNFLRRAMSKDHFLGLIDWVEAHKPEPAVAKIYSNKVEDGPAFVVSSGQRFPLSKVDFGWGKPSFGSYHFPWGGNCGYVMPMPSPLGNGDWVVYMHLRTSQLDFIEEKACGVIELVNLSLIGLA
ncbi:hypothetical protein vseg_002762 [Gypsophila vaccaria]